MILVNNPGSWAYVYPPFLHAQWHGWTPTDLIFPFFLFIVGVSITLCVYGMNAITVFVLTGGVGRLLYLIKWPSGEEVITLKEWLMNTLFMPWLSPVNASLAYALFFVFISYISMYYLYNKQIFIKV